MSNLKWPPIALCSNGTQVTPREAKSLFDETFTIWGVNVIPRTGEVNQDHWASPGIGECEHLRPGYEMSDWHYQKQLDANADGLLTEYRIDLDDGSRLYADAYDAKTNTLIEYVWSHFSPKKIEIYFDLGYNQEWIFAEEQKSKLSDYYWMVSKLNWEKPAYHLNEESKSILDLYKNLPRITRLWAI